MAVDLSRIFREVGSIKQNCCPIWASNAASIRDTEKPGLYLWEYLFKRCFLVTAQEGLHLSSTDYRGRGRGNHARGECHSRRNKPELYSGFA